MYSRNFPVAKTVGIAVVLVCALIFLESSLVKRNAVSVKKQNSFQSTFAKVCKTVLLSEIEQAFIKSNSKKIFLNIYPLKASKNPKKNDYSFSYKFGDTAAQLIYTDKQMSNKLFHQQSYNYIHSLKERNTPKHLIPLGYYIEMNAGSIKTNLELCMNDLDKTIVLFENNSELPVKAGPRDSCKCPPVCPCVFMISAEAGSVKNIINKVYAKN